ncbi:MAG: hypothetical protein OXH94_11265 [Rhodospirillales bacterium]|nr:hypothetical protein [Rhodospirillales bacterium]
MAEAVEEVGFGAILVPVFGISSPFWASRPLHDYLPEVAGAPEDGLEHFSFLELDLRAVGREVKNGLAAHAQQFKPKSMPWTSGGKRWTGASRW